MWVKKGLIYKPCVDKSWMETHVAVPTLKKINENYYRVYFGGRGYDNFMRIGYIEININNLLEIHKICDYPIFDIGSLGAFDDSGVTPSWIISQNGLDYLYYTGWMRGKSVPYYLSVGLAISKDGGNSFYRYSKGPLLNRNEVDPYLTASPCILLDDGLFKMWYVSGVGWEQYNNIVRPNYHIKYAESKDGLNWERRGEVSIDFQHKKEWAISRPSVIKSNGLYKMWYSYSIDGYRIGYAESYDGIKWNRKDDEIGINLSSNDWDSEMMAYPYVFCLNDKKYMLYNGNGYGKTGFGYAISQNGIRVD